MGERSDSDSDFESAEDESEYFSVTGGSQEEIQFHQFNLGNLSSRGCDQDEDETNNFRESSEQIRSLCFMNNE